MKKPELLLPAGNKECLRAAVNNGANAVYFGLNKFNARQFAENFSETNIHSIIKYCHDRNVKAYIALNTLVKNSELKEYFNMISIASQAGADAVIIQEHCFAPIIKKNFPQLKIHLSTQAAATNSYSIPKEINRVILARELTLEEIKNIENKTKTEIEIFVHGALCISCSGQCLFSSIAGGRSGNRGQCAQPCRKKYNNKYALSTMDLCMLEKIPELIEAGISSFKIEGRMRSPLYAATAARTYRKAIDSYCAGKIAVDKKDIDNLKTAFSREFTTGFCFENKTIVDSNKPMNRGLFLGIIKDGKIKLQADLKLGDGIGVWRGDEVNGGLVQQIIKNNKLVREAFQNDVIELEASDGSKIYKTSSAETKINLGDEIKEIKFEAKKKEIILPEIKNKENKDKTKLFVKCYNKKSAIDADKAGADIIYYDLMKEDCAEARKLVKNSKFFVYAPRIQTDTEVEETIKQISQIKPDGILIGNRGLLYELNKNHSNKYEIHLDYSFNCFNDIDLECNNAIPIISPELNFKEVCEMKNKNFIVLVHGDLVLMTTKEQIKAPELIDEENRHFKIRKYEKYCEILNSKQLGLFNKTKEYLKNGIKYFYIDLQKEPEKFVRIYRKIIEGEHFDDTKIKKGCTTGHFERGVY